MSNKNELLEALQDAITWTILKTSDEEVLEILQQRSQDIKAFLETRRR